MSELAGQWMRVSTTGQDETSQSPDLAAWIAGHGYELAATYRVHGLTAFHDHPKFKRAWSEVLDDIRAGKITVLVVWKTDRIDRKLETFQRIAEVVEAGGRIEFVTQPHLNDLSSMGGRIALKVQEEIAYAESKDKSDRIKANHAMIRVNNGAIGRPTYGYRAMGDKYGKRFVIESVEAAVLREMATRYLDGETIDALCADLMARGISAPMFKGQPGKVWHAKTLAGLLRSTSSAGIKTNSAGKVVGQFDAILTWDTHTQLVERLDSRAHRQGISPKNVALLTSILFDKHGHPLYRINKWQGSAYYCRKCHESVDLAEMDNRIHEMSARDNGRYLIPVVVTEDHAKDIMILRNEKDSLDDLDESNDARIAELTAEMRALAKLPKTRTVEMKDSGMTHAERWASLDDSQRRDDMLEMGMRVIWHGAGKWELIIPEDGRAELIIN